MRTSVIVVSYRPHEWLLPCLRSVLDQADEVVLVDNGSADVAISSVGRDTGVRVHRLKTNTGFAGGVNAGLEIATGDIVALLNDDAMAEPGWLDAASRTLADSEVAAVAPKLLFVGQFARVNLLDESHFAPGDGRPLGRQLFEVMVDGLDVLGGVVGGVHRLEAGAVDGCPARWRWTLGRDPFYIPLPEGANSDNIRINGVSVATSWVGNVVNNAGSYLSVHGHGGDYGFETADDGRFDEPAERFAATGAAMVARAETFRKLGGLAARFFAYYEDTDWCWRARLAGLKIRYDPDAVVRHVRSVTSGGTSAPLVRLLAARNRILCLARNAPPSFVWRQLSGDWGHEPVPGFRRSVARHLPPQLVERRRLARLWTVEPAEVLNRWAGVDERWDVRTAES
jgi:GT2 family glycosyltransferase